MTSTNVFDDPMKYLAEIKGRVRIPVNKRKRAFGKTYLCAWITKLCPAKCLNCFFKSNMQRDTVLPERSQFSDYGLERLIKFVNDSNNSYIQLSGGGEPMIRRDAVLEIVKRVKTDRIVIVTSGLWATSHDKAKEIIFELYEAYKTRKDNTIVVLRLSIDDFHQKPLGFDVLVRIVKVYQEYFQHTPNFQLRVHTIAGDPTLREFADIYGDCSVVESPVELMSDNNEVIKIMPKQASLVFKDGYEVHVGIAKLFFSDLRMDLNSMTPEIQDALEVFEQDMTESEYGNPSTITNTMGPLGLDFWMDYNGNVTTWGNQQLDQLYNIYCDDFKDIAQSTFDNVLSYSFVDKGFFYRERVIRDVNPKAALRSKVLNLRDYAGAFILEEERTRLYYGIRVVKDYLDDGVLDTKDIADLSPELRELICGETASINVAYHASTHDIIGQYLKKPVFDKDEWVDLFSLIKLGHYGINDENLQKAIDNFNLKTGSNATSIHDIAIREDDVQYGRLHNRVSFMKPEAEQFCFQMRSSA